MRASDLLVAINFDFQYFEVDSLKLIFDDKKFYEIKSIKIEERKLIFDSVGAKPIGAKQVFTQLMLNKNLKVYKRNEILIPVFGYEIIDQEIIL